MLSKNMEKVRFKKSVKLALVERGMTQRELCALISADLGIKADPPYICDVIAGKRPSAPVKNSIAKILKLEV